MQSKESAIMHRRRRSDDGGTGPIGSSFDRCNDRSSEINLGRAEFTNPGARIHFACYGVRGCFGRVICTRPEHHSAGDTIIWNVNFPIYRRTGYILSEYWVGISIAILQLQPCADVCTWWRPPPPPALYIITGHQMGQMRK